jgi:sec-independent protein translocase protein TatA
MNPLFLIFGLGGQEIFFVFIIVLLLFGGNKIPELMRGLGKGIREFNSARANVEDEIRKGMEDVDKKKIEETK